jgi:large subunit ribosomal protein L28
LVVSSFLAGLGEVEVDMARECDVCGKGPVMGNTVTTRGKAKYLGGVGTKVTGINKRQFKPNLQRVRVTVAGTNKSMRVCTQCIRSGAITKLIKAAPFRLPTADVAPKASGPKATGPKATGPKAAGPKATAPKASASKAAAPKAKK